MNYEEGLKSYAFIVKEICPDITDEKLNKLVSNYKYELMCMANDLENYTEEYDLRW